MKKQIKLLITLVLCLSVCLSMMIVPASAAKLVGSGKCGEDVSWKLDSNGLLTISGNGEMTSSPWCDYGDLVKKVVIENGVTNICEIAFWGCASLESVTMADSVKEIGIEAFYLCENLKTVKLSNNLKTISDEAFYNCTGLESITIPDSVKSIGVEAFYNCTALENISIGSGVKKIGYRAFYKTSYYKNSKNWKDGILYIGNYLISAKENIASCNINPRTKAIADNAFEYCKNLTNITVPDGVTCIGLNAFYGCSNLESITIPDSVTNIDGSFDITAYYNNSENWEGKTLYIGKHLIAAKTDIESCDIKPGTKTIAGNAFANCAFIESIIIPDSVVSIGRGAFTNCFNLREINIPDSITSIAPAAFTSCTGLATITLPFSVTDIGDNAFSECRNLESIVMTDSITSIDAYAFFGCTSLTAVGFVGSESQWNKIKISEGNEYLLSAIFVFSTHTHKFTNYTYNNDAKFGVDGTETGVCECGKTDTRTKKGTALNSKVNVTVADFPIKLGEQVMDSKNEEYPFIIYNNITYLPLTYYGCRSLGLSSNWTQESGLVIERTGEVLTYVPTPATSSNSGKLTAEIASGKISLSGTPIDNMSEEYPFLIFREVTYLPMTWMNMNDTLGCSYAYDADTGLTVGTTTNPDLIEVQIATFPVKLGGQTIDCVNDQYPFIINNGITYLPLTYYGCSALGLSSSWTPETGLIVKGGGEIAQYQQTPNIEPNDGVLTASMASGAIEIATSWIVTSIDNTAEEYPFLIFREVTYMPMTWHNMFDILGCEYSFDFASGLSIGVSKK